MKKRTICLFLATILLSVCFLPACANSQPEETKAKKPANIMQESDPAEDDTLNILI